MQKKVRLLIIILPFFALAVLTLIISISLINSFKPKGFFEGQWKGGIRAEGGSPVEIILDINEQSAGYGHLRIRTDSTLPFNDEIYPCLFEKKTVLVNSNDFSFSGTRSVDHGIAYLDFTIVSEEDQKYEGSVQLILSVPEL